MYVVFELKVYAPFASGVPAPDTQIIEGRTLTSLLLTATTA
jgi:hypothetical protein